MTADESESATGKPADTFAIIKEVPADMVAGLKRATGGAENKVGGAATPTNAPGPTVRILAWVAAAHACPSFVA